MIASPERNPIEFHAEEHGRPVSCDQHSVVDHLLRRANGKVIAAGDAHLAPGQWADLSFLLVELLLGNQKPRVGLGNSREDGAM